MSQDVERTLSALRAEAFETAYRKRLLKEVEDLWNKDAEFRYGIRSIVKNSEFKDTRGKKQRVNIEMALSLLRLGSKLGLTQDEVLRCLPEDIEIESIKRSLHRERKRKSQAT